MINQFEAQSKNKEFEKKSTEPIRSEIEHQNTAKRPKNEECEEKSSELIGSESEYRNTAKRPKTASDSEPSTKEQISNDKSNRQRGYERNDKVRNDFLLNLIHLVY